MTAAVSPNLQFRIFMKTGKKISFCMNSFQ